MKRYNHCALAYNYACKHMVTDMCLDIIILLLMSGQLQLQVSMYMYINVQEHMLISLNTCTVSILLIQLHNENKILRDKILELERRLENKDYFAMMYQLVSKEEP